MKSLGLALSKERKRVWLLFGAGVLVALLLQREARVEGQLPDRTLMHWGWLVFFASFGAWALLYRGLYRWLIMGMVTLMCVLLLSQWYQFRNQKAVPLGKGAWQITTE